MKNPLSFACALVISAVLVTPQAQAVDVRITVRNLTPSGSVAFSPFTLAAHNGSFDAFDSGSAAAPRIENIAELGDGTDLINDVTTAQPTAVTGHAFGSFGPGIFLPGDSGSVVLTLDPMQNRYLTYGAMVVPSNDAFLGNDSPTAVELFDAGGNFVATDFVLTGSNIWDAGTEVNQLLGSAYVVGQDATLGTDENGVVHTAPLPAEFSLYSGSMVPSGGTFSVIPIANDSVASFSFEIIPEPSSMAFAGLGLVTTLLTGARARRPSLQR